MAITYEPKHTSDVSGAVVPNDQVVTVIFDGKRWDMSLDELAKLKPLDNVNQLEIQMPDTSVRQLLCSKKDFDTLITREMFEKFGSSRGRRSGVKLNGNGNGN